MAEHRILIFEGQAFLSVQNGRLKISRPNHDCQFVLPEDIDVMVLNHPAITITSQVFDVLSAANVVSYIIGTNHYPATLFYPQQNTTQTVKRLHQQIAIVNTDKAENLWAKIVEAKIKSQIATLSVKKLIIPERLNRLIHEINAGDPENKEAEAAKLYWKNLFGKSFRREKMGATDLVNVSLNYGYAVLRSLIARQVCYAGLNPSLGIKHHNLENPFNLVDDLIEPFRFIVDNAVYELKKQLVDAQYFSPQLKKLLITGMIIDVPVGKSIVRNDTATTLFVDSFTRILNGDENCKLNFPRYDLWAQMDGE